QGRNFAARKLLPGLRSSLTSLGRLARSPVKLALLFGGSALVTLAYVGGLAASVEAFGGGAGIVQIGAVYMASSLVAAASPTPGHRVTVQVRPSTTSGGDLWRCRRIPRLSSRSTPIRR